MVLPFWLVSRKGPPIAAVGFASGAGPRPETSSTTAKHSTRPARNADRISSWRVVRGFMLSTFSAHSRASGNPGPQNWVPAFRGTSGIEDGFSSARDLEARRDTGRDDLEE